MRLVNGCPVPEAVSLEELGRMLESSDMQEFALGCEGLKDIHTSGAYALLKEHLGCNDKYKYRYVLSVIFSFDQSAELQEHFIQALKSEEKILVTTVLGHLMVRNIWASDEQILSCFEKNHNELNPYYYGILSAVLKTDAYTDRVVRLLERAKTDSVKIAVAECLKDFATEENYLKLYGLLAESAIPKLRMEACRIAARFNRADLLMHHRDDSDGHIRSYVKQVLGGKNE